MAAGFMAGFGTTLSELIEKDREYYRAKAEKRKDYLQTYGTKAVVDIESKANDALSVANRLQNFGFSKEFVTGITTKSGVRGMYDFADQVLKRTDLTPADIKELETSAVDFVNSNPEEDLETVINRAYGLYKSESDPVKRKTGMLGAMLGLDARALEDEIINADYYGGYSGQDLIRIAASSGPKAGKPLGIKLPPKPISPSELNIVNNALSTQFDSSISRQMDEISTAMGSTSLSAEARQTLTAKYTKLEELVTIAKTNEGEAMARYISNPEYEGGAFLTYLQGIEANRLGSVSNNFLLGDYFRTTYSALTAGEDIPTTAESGQPPAGQPPAGQPPAGQPPQAYTPTELRAALAANEIKVGTKVEVNGNVVTVTRTQIDKAKVETGKDLSTSIEDEAAMQRREAALNDLDLSVPTPGLTDDDMGLPDGPVPKSLIPAIQSGNETAEWISASSEDLNTSVTSNAFRLGAAVESGMATAIDFLTGIVGGTEETGVSKALKRTSKYQAEQAAEVATKGFTEYWTSDLEDGDGFKPEFPGDVPEGVVNEVKGSYLDAIMNMLGMGESSETKMVNGTPMTDAEVLAAARAQLDEAANARNELDMTHSGTVMKSFVPFAIGMIPTDSYTTGEDDYDLTSGLSSLATKYYDFSREEIEEWFKTYTEGGELKLNQGKEKSFYDGIYKAYSELQEARTIKKALARSDDIDDKLAMQRRETALNDFDLPVGFIDYSIVNDGGDLRAAIEERIGDMPRDYIEAFVPTVKRMYEDLKEFETNVNVGIRNAIDNVTVDNIAEVINNMAVRMFDTVVGDETLEERIMQNEGQRNRAAAFAKLQQQFSELTFFPKGVPGKIDLGPTMGEVSSDWLHSTQDNINSAIVSAAKSLLAKVGIGKPSNDKEFNDALKAETQPEPLVTRPKRTKKPKQMTASDKARLKRAQKVKELSGDSGLLEMLVEKYGIALVQKEMGL